MSAPHSETAQSHADLIRGMQAAAFAGDWEGFQSFFTPRTRYRVGNVVDLTGAANIAGFLKEMFATKFQFTDMRPRQTRHLEDTVIVEYDMDGMRLADRTQVRYPCVDVYEFGEGKFEDWRVYPIEPLFITRQPTVRTEPNWKSQRGRIATLPLAIQEFQHSLSQADSRQTEARLTSDTILRVADNPEATGPAAFVRSLREVFSKRLRPASAEFLNVWTFPDALVAELKVDAVRVSDKSRISYRCVETYRLTNDLIREYRIYPLESSLLVSGSG